jgi:cytochrome c5
VETRLNPGWQAPRLQRAVTTWAAFAALVLGGAAVHAQAPAPAETPAKTQAAAPAAETPVDGTAVYNAASRALHWGDFAEAERLFKAARAQPRRTTAGLWEVVQLHRGFENGLATSRGLRVRQAEHTVALTGQWVQQHPRSPLAHALHVVTLTNLAWAYRGSGYANTVAPQAWALFRGALDGVVHLDIFGATLEVAVEGEEACMFARAVVVALAGLFVRLDEAVPFGGVIGFMRAAAQIGIGKAEVGEPAGDGIGVDSRTLMAGAGQRDLAIGQAMGIRRAGFEERQGLNHLAGGAGEDDRAGVAPAFDDLACLVADHGMAEMGAFQHSPPPKLDHRDGCGHRFLHQRHRCAIFCPRGFRGLVFPS